ncbi:MAG: hypothetical protein ABI720_01085 [Actinomycetes bacterium]
MSIGRRSLIKAAGCAGLGFGLFGCTDPADPTPRSQAQNRVTPGASATPSGTPDTLPSTRAWRPAPRDVAPEVKQAAVLLAEVAGTWGPDEAGTQHLRKRLRAAGYDPDLADDLGPLTTADDSAVTEVVVAQYGGILSESASVLIVIDQWVLSESGQVQRRGTTLDVRLVADEPQWSVTTVRPARPGRRDSGISDAARRLLGNDRVVLPLAAVRDVRAGAIDDSVLRALSSLSKIHRLDVSILRSGHPVRVFGTDRTSNHTEGRAVDIWALDGKPIIKRTSSAMVVDFMVAARDVGAYQVGGPVDVDGTASVFFADDTHQDHLHLGFAD